MKTTQMTKTVLVALALVVTGAWINEANAQGFSFANRRFSITIGRPAPVYVQRRTVVGRPNYWANQNWWNNGWNANDALAPNPFFGNPFVSQVPVQPVVHRRPNVSGTWTSRYGKVILVQTGNRITGTIFKSSGRRTAIRGRIHGRTIKFTWRSSGRAYGKGRLTIRGRKRMTGLLTNTRTGIQGTFNLVR